MKDYYKILGVNRSASNDEIRRAYRTLARRYHPDVNPDSYSEERFHEIREAYEVLKSSKARLIYNLRFESHLRGKLSKKIRSYQEAQAGRKRTQHANPSTVPPYAQEKKMHSKKKDSRPLFSPASLTEDLTRRVSESYRYFSQIFKKRTGRTPSRGTQVSHISIVEVTITVREAIRGAIKKIEIQEEGDRIRIVTVPIPAGARDGSIIRLREKEDPSAELVLVVRLMAHPFLSIKAKGTVIELPITLHEALYGAHISAPGIDEEILIKVPPGTQSGAELRVVEKGIIYPKGKRGDLFYRFLIRAPESPSAVGLPEKAQAIEQYYERSVRESLPPTLEEI